MADDTAMVWKALADPTRRAILDLLRDRARTTGEVSDAFPGLSRFAVMKHLAVLERAGLVLVRRSGRERWNHLNGVPLRVAYERWMRPHADRWADSLLRLKDEAERREGGGMAGTSAPAASGTLDVEQEVVVAAPRERVFDAIGRMGEWWPHRFREGSTVHLEPQVGGRFWEDWGDGDGALYAIVRQLQRPARIECSGPMGMAGPVTSVFALELEERGGGTLVRLSHRAIGQIDEQTQAAYEGGWVAVFDALRGHLGLSA
jgi:DNA-binding transcriptional ArsR family regulator